MANRTDELIAELAEATDEYRIRILTELQGLRRAHHARIFALWDAVG
jgi:hypothetical protein